MKAYKIKDIPPDHFFPAPVFLDDKIILATPEMPFSRAIIRTLEDWGFDEVYSAGKPKKALALDGVDEDETGDSLNGTIPTDSEKITKAEKFFADLINYTENLFSQISEKNPDSS